MSSGFTIKNVNESDFVFGKIAEVLSSRGDRILRYSLEIRHIGLGDIKLVSAPEIHILEAKTNKVVESLKNSWTLKQQQAHKAQSQEEALADTIAAEEVQLRIRNILHDTLEIDDTIIWESLKDFTASDEHIPQKPLSPTPVVLPSQPMQTDLKYRPTLTIWNHIWNYIYQPSAKRIQRKAKRSYLGSSRDLKGGFRSHRQPGAFRAGAWHNLWRGIMECCWDSMIPGKWGM